jgi:ammonium transporter Rh
MAMIGTLFLFCFWPSFNGALAGLDVQDRAIANTLLAIATSCITAFLICCLVDVRGTFGMVEVQNATIVGGVAMGAAADMVVNPFGAMCVGMFASIVSVLGYRFLTPALERGGLRDTYGIHNLYGLPGIIGGIVSAIAAGAARFGSYHGTYDQVAPDPSQSRSTQAGYQLAALALSLGMGLVGGLITGLIIARLPSLPAFFEDVYEYIVPEEHHTTPADQAMLSTDPAIAEAQRLAPAITPTNATGAPSATEHGASHAHTKALEHVQMNSNHPYPAVVGDNVAPVRAPTPTVVTQR